MCSRKQKGQKIPGQHDRSSNQQSAHDGLNDVTIKNPGISAGLDGACF